MPDKKRDLRTEIFLKRWMMTSSSDEGQPKNNYGESLKQDEDTEQPTPTMVEVMGMPQISASNG